MHRWSRLPVLAFAGAGLEQWPPLYDVVSAWPEIGDGPGQVPWQKAKLAMAVRSKSAHSRLGEIQPRHWQELARKSGVDGAWEAMVAMIDTVDAVIEPSHKNFRRLTLPWWPKKYLRVCDHRPGYSRVNL